MALTAARQEITLVPSVSIVLPTYNRAHFLPGAVRSVQDQTYQDWEVVLVDDASTDDTAGVMAGVSDPRVFPIRLPENRGAAGARNAALELVRGRYVAFLDSDDAWHPEYLARQVGGLEEAGEGVVLSYAGARFVDAATGRARVRVPGRSGNLAAAMRWTNVVGNCSRVVVRTAALKAVGGFDTGLEQCEDWDLWLRVCDRGRVRAEPRILVTYAEHAGSLQGQGESAIRGRRAFWAKHRLLDGDPRRAAFHLARFAHELCYRGDVAAGRGFAAHALRLRPAYLPALGVAAASLLGTGAYRALSFHGAARLHGLIDALHRRALDGGSGA